MLVAEEAVEIRVLRRQGQGIREIARLLNVSRNTVSSFREGTRATLSGLHWRPMRQFSRNRAED